MRIKRPSPAMLVAIAALVLAAGGLAVAAIPSADGTIHGCYKKDGGALRVVQGTQCKAGERALSWNRGVARVVVRTKTLSVPVACQGSGQFTYCSGTNAATVSCRAGERATGGGYGQSQNGTTSSVQESKPYPIAGRPTGWTVSATGFKTGVPAAAAAQVPIHVVCAN